MKTFDEIYEELQNADNEELKNAWEEARKESKRTRNISLIICTIIDIIAIMMFNGNKITSALPFAILPMIITVFVINMFVVLIVNLLFGKNKNKYNLKYKQIVINKIMSNFYDNLEYFPLKPMPEYIYKQGNYNEYYNIYLSEDYFEAQIDQKHSIQMAEVRTVKEETYRDSDGNTKTRRITKFHGLFGKIEMNKSINNQLKITQNGKVTRKNKLNMDSSEFEKYFDVQASNKIVGMQLLTSDVMEELIEFQNKTNMRYDIFINNNELYLRFHSGGMFEAGKLKKGTIDKEILRKYYYMLNFAYNLSNRIIKLIHETEI